ncbi:hypothetical protein DVH05_004820 [Phytophthora capsici]|nr:hypothetical protein DVH05_004820 [Phytophthora capsici]
MHDPVALLRLHQLISNSSSPCSQQERASRSRNTPTNIMFKTINKFFLLSLAIVALYNGVQAEQEAAQTLSLLGANRGGLYGPGEGVTVGGVGGTSGVGVRVGGLGVDVGGDSVGAGVGAGGVGVRVGGLGIDVGGVGDGVATNANAGATANANANAGAMKQTRKLRTE